MGYWSHRVVCAAVVVVLVALLAPALASAAPASERYIVTFDSADHGAAVKQIGKLGGTKVKDLRIVNGAVFKLPSRASAKAVRALAGVNTVELDAIQYAYKGKPVPPPPAESLPWGVDKIDADLVWPTYLGTSIKVGIIDTGIDITHPDLAANIKGGVSCVDYTTSFNDDNGHGSHVAGTVAAVDNTIGVIGVAPSASLYGIKVLNRSGRGYTSDIIEGMQWAIDNNMDVINMSLGGPTYVEAYETATNAVLDAGVVFVAAAGNEGPEEDTVGYPAKFEGVIAVAATDSADVVASFSSRGPEVDVAAPGVSIFSTTKSGGYATMSGTSMAAPHVTGAVALVLQSPIAGKSWDLDGDGRWDPLDVERRLESTSLDLGTTGFDTAYGWGRIRANLAIGL